MGWASKKLANLAPAPRAVVECEWSLRAAGTRKHVPWDFGPLASTCCQIDGYEKANRQFTCSHTSNSALVPPNCGMVKVRQHGTADLLFHVELEVFRVVRAIHLTAPPYAASGRREGTSRLSGRRRHLQPVR